MNANSSATAYLLTSVAFAAISVPPAAAASRKINIVALGDSNFGAPGVARDQTYPAQLEQALRARGFDVSITNAGINGDTTAGVLRRMDSDVPRGTDIVLLSIGINDVVYQKAAPEEAAARGNEIAARIEARGIAVLRLGTGKKFQGTIANDCRYHVECRVPGQTGPEPGTTKWHLNADGYAMVVKRTLPQVVAAVRKAEKKPDPAG